MIRDIIIGLLLLKGVNTFRQSDGGHGSWNPLRSV
jgi:hypothetical protein